LSAYGDVVDEEYIRTERFRKILLKKHLQKVRNYCKPGNMLDVGSFAGYFLELAKEEGWKTHGVEPSSWATKIASKRGIKHVGKDILSAKTKTNYYDAITMWDVIEHLTEPHTVISKLNTMLKKDGILALGTPDVESIFAKALGKRCPFLIRMHIILYSPRTLKKLLMQHGFKILDVSYYGRTFPLSYFIDRLHIKNPLLKSLVSLPKRLPLIANSTITINLHDSFRIIAQKI
jgi:2-polyprenyl-3-methyl-5-hydroxy-6-metoxy-1,4-benzoquinol methylase